MEIKRFSTDLHLKLGPGIYKFGLFSTFNIILSLMYFVRTSKRTENFQNLKNNLDTTTYIVHE